MQLPLKDRVKIEKYVHRIQTGLFDENDVDGLLIKLRAYATTNSDSLEVAHFLEVAHYVAHSDERIRGQAHDSITAIVDSMRFVQEFSVEKKPLVLDEPFPLYIHRLFISQTRLIDELELKKKHKMSRATLIKKIEASFSTDSKMKTCVLRNNKGGPELFEALRFVLFRIHGKATFHIGDFLRDIKKVMIGLKVHFEEAAWDAQASRVSLAVLCLISNTKFRLQDGTIATCELATERHFRILRGQRQLPDGTLTSEPSRFGHLVIMGAAATPGTDKGALRIRFPLIATDLDPHEHCDRSLFFRDRVPDSHGSAIGIAEFIDFAPDMSLSKDFNLIRTDSLLL